MKPSTLNDWLTVATNIGVIAGIIFLAMEVRQGQQSIEQSNELSELSVYSMAIDFHSNFRQMLLENPIVLDVWDRGMRGDQLDGLETNQFNLTCEEYFWYNAALHQRGEQLGDTALLQGNDAHVAQIANFVSVMPGLRGCWNNGLKDAISAFDVSFVTEIETYLLENQL